MGLLAYRVLLTQTQTVSHIPKGFLYIWCRGMTAFLVDWNATLRWLGLFYYFVLRELWTSLPEKHSISWHSILCRFSWEMRGRPEWFDIECCVDGLSKRVLLRLRWSIQFSVKHSQTSALCFTIHACILISIIWHIYKSKHPNSLAGWTPAALEVMHCVLCSTTHTCAALWSAPTPGIRGGGLGVNIKRAERKRRKAQSAPERHPPKTRVPEAPPAVTVRHPFLYNRPTLYSLRTLNSRSIIAHCQWRARVQRCVVVCRHDRFGYIQRQEI
jgi:hypothetical protein